MQSYSKNNKAELYMKTNYNYLKISIDFFQTL